MDTLKVLVVDDDEDIRSKMRWALMGEYLVSLAENRNHAMDVFKKERPAVVTLDCGRPLHASGAVEGFATLKEMLAEEQTAKVIVITGSGDRANALSAIECGAYDFLENPIQFDMLKVVIQRAAHLYRLEREIRILRAGARGGGFDHMIGSSSPMQQIFDTIRRVARADVAVLVTGERGTGKELVARAIHRHSARSNGPFVAVNCGAVSENLIESELFGHEKGAFPGVPVQRKGLIESAQGGTLFFDEIGELPLALQVKLLLFLQERKVKHIGGRKEIAVDARVIAATNRKLVDAVRKGQFRDDLYERLGGVTMVVPPLRERGADIVLIARTLLERYAAQNGKQTPRFTKHAMAAIRNHHWPGNVRELENRIERAVIMTEGRSLTAEDLEFVSPHVKYEGQSLKDARASLESELIKHTLAKCQWNISRTAIALGISRPTLHQLITKYRINR